MKTVEQDKSGPV